MRISVYSVCTIFILFFGLGLSADYDLDPVQSTELRLDNILRQHRFRDAHISETMMELSEYQNALLSLLYRCESQEHLIEALHHLEVYDQKIRHKKSNDLTLTFNFYAGTRECVTPQEVSVESVWGEQTAFLNTFKMGRDLTAEERERFFDQEYACFMRDSLIQPFVLDSRAISDLQPEVLYNFTLHPDGTVMAALERPGEKEYRVRDNEVVQAFTHPNHTILAGSPHQPVLAAGALIVYECEGKRIYFISSKSGHFQPTYNSLEQMRRWFGERGIDVRTIVPLPDVDMAQHALNNYSLVEVPVLVTQSDAKKMFERARDRWLFAYKRIDKTLLEKLAMGDLTVLNEEMVNALALARDEANYMRNAYFLFSSDHKAPSCFDLFVTRFGKLKDAMLHGGRNEQIQNEASIVVALLKNYGAQILQIETDYTSEKAFYLYLQKRIAKIRFFLEKEQLSVKQYHKIKKSARELGTLFALMAEENRIEGRHYFLYRTVSLTLFDINRIMGEELEVYVEEELHNHGETAINDIVLCEKLRNKLLNRLDHLTLEPPHFDFVLVESFAEKLFKRAAFEWWIVHHNLKQGVIREKDDLHYGTVKQLLREILNGEITSSESDIERALYHLKILRYRVEDALDLYRLLDHRHDLPSDVEHYVMVLDRLIEDITNKRRYLERREYNAAWMSAYLSDSSWPFRDPHRFESDTAEGLENAVLQSLILISKLIESDLLERDEVVLIRDKAKQLAVPFNLIREDRIVDGIEEYRSLSKTCYESIAMRLERLVSSLSKQIDTGQDLIRVRKEERELAQHVLNKLSNQFDSLKKGPEQSACTTRLNTSVSRVEPPFLCYASSGVKLRQIGSLERKL